MAGEEKVLLVDPVSSAVVAGLPRSREVRPVLSVNSLAAVSRLRRDSDEPSAFLAIVNDDGLCIAAGNELVVRADLEESRGMQ
jgi:hypothetical protein